MSYIIPTGELSYSDQAGMRMQAVENGKRALKARANVVNPVDRDADYPVDFVPVATRAGLAGWLTMPLVAPAVNYSVFADNVPAALTPQVPNNNVWVFYGCEILTLNDPVTQLFFATGTAANRKAQFDLEKLYTKLETSGYFTQPVVYDPQEIVTALVRARLATGVGCRFVLFTIIIEPLQVSVT